MALSGCGAPMTDRLRTLEPIAGGAVPLGMAVRGCGTPPTDRLRTPEPIAGGAVPLGMAVSGCGTPITVRPRTPEPIAGGAVFFGKADLGNLFRGNPSGCGVLATGRRTIAPLPDAPDEALLDREFLGIAFGGEASGIGAPMGERALLPVPLVGT
jgi:hypothetical protein